MNTLIAFILFLLVTYPGSPVLFLIFGSFNKGIYVLFSVSLLFLVLFKKLRLKPGGTIYFAFLVSYSLVYGANIVSANNITAVRDLVTIAPMLAMIIGFPKYLIINIFRKYVLLNAVFLLVSIIVALVFYIIGFDEWNVSQLSMVSKNSPVYIRNEWGDYNYFMPLYLALITISNQVHEVAFGLTFERAPLLYMEPSTLWAYTLGLFFYSLGDKNLPFRPMVLLVFLVALVWSFSVFGVLVFVFMWLFYFYSRFNFLRKIYLSTLFIVLSSLVVVYNNPYLFELVLTNIGGNKYAQYVYYSEVIALDKSSTLFGVSPDILDAHRSYGLTAVLVRYGVFGLTVYVLIWMLILIQTLVVCRNTILGSKTTTYYGMAVISTLLLYFKFPQMNLLLPILLLAMLKIAPRYLDGAPRASCPRQSANSGRPIDSLI